MNAAVTDIVLVRHPETIANTDGTLVGRGDAPFTDEGRRQLARLPEVLAGFGPDIVHTSPLQRTSVLANEVARVSGAELRVDERLIEIEFGDAEGLTVQQARERGIVVRYDAEDVPVAPGGESRRDVWSRVDEFVCEIERQGGTHVVVTHGGPFRAALARLLGLTSDHIWSFHVRNAQIAHVRVTDGWGVLERYVEG